MNLWPEKEGVRFIVSRELGRLARWLRILGYDTSYFDSIDKRGLLITALREGRLIITRTSAFKDHHGLEMIYIESDRVEEQIKQVIAKLRLIIPQKALFSRCVECNQILENISKQEVKGKVPPYVFKTVEQFKKCPDCKKIYWVGTHWNNVKKFAARLGALNSRGG